MSPPRFRLRTLMATVAVSAMLFWGGIEGVKTKRRWRQYREDAALYAFKEEMCREAAARPHKPFRCGNVTVRMTEEYWARIEREEDREHPEDAIEWRRLAEINAQRKRHALARW